MTLPFHPLADLFPLITGTDFEALVADIRDHGLREPIILHDKQILDGRNRYRAMQQLVETGEVLGDGWGHRRGEALTPSVLEPPQLWFNAYNHALDGDPLAWVISKNLKRRHLDESQRSMVASKLATMRQGERTDLVEPSANLPKVDQQAAARLLNVSSRSLRSARTVREHGAPALAEAVEQGKVAVSTAETIARAAPAEQAEILEAAGGDEKKILAAAKEIRSRQRKQRFEQVTEKLAAISEDSKPLPTGQKYPVIYADPATRYVSGFSDRSIENHYPTMTIEELCALPVSDLALPDAVLFIWTTIPQLRNTMRIIEAWGFNYVSAWCWDKVDHGTGHWGFNQHEELLIATRGRFPAPVPGTQPRSLYREKKSEHSRKPEWFAEQIARLYPALQKIELFARRARAGWAVWGNQADAATEEASRETPPDCDVAQSRKLPPAPRIGEPMEFSVGGLRKNIARFGVRQREDGCFDIDYTIEFTTAGKGGPWHGGFASFEEALRAGMLMLRKFFVARRDAIDSVTTDAERRAARAGLDWIEARCGEWGLALDDNDSQAKASAGNGATESDLNGPADSTSGEASRLAGGRTPDGAARSVDLAALEIPAFLKRGPNNELPAPAVEHA